jgi:hypothetical protein
LEAGVNLRQMQEFLGHSTLQTATIYLHLTTVGEEAAVAKIRAVYVLIVAAAPLPVKHRPSCPRCLRP